MEEELYTTRQSSDRTQTSPLPKKAKIKNEIVMDFSEEQESKLLAEFDLETMAIQYQAKCDEAANKRLEALVQQLERENMELKLENAILTSICP